VDFAVRVLVVEPSKIVVDVTPIKCKAFDNSRSARNVAAVTTSAAVPLIVRVSFLLVESQVTAVTPAVLVK